MHAGCLKVAFCSAKMAAKDMQALPTKEQSLFKQVVKFYETKQYKKAIKAAEQVLKKFPDHGETLAMKVTHETLAYAVTCDVGTLLSPMQGMFA